MGTLSCVIASPNPPCQIPIPAYERSPAGVAVTPPYSEPLSIEARFTRTTSVFLPPNQVNLELRLTNKSLQKQTLQKIHSKSGCATPFAEIGKF